MIHSEGFLKVVDDARSRIQEISVDEVRARQEHGEDFAFVDVREDLEWAQSRAAGAMHLGRGVIERDIERVIPDKEKEIVLYCGGGFRSALAADMLQKMGYRHVKSMAGGFRAWREQRCQIVS